MNWRGLIQSGNLHGIRAYLAAGASLEHRLPRGIHGRWLHRARPLHHAAVYGSEAVVEALLEAGAEVESRGVEGRTALIYSASVGRRAICELLIAAGANRDTVDDRGRTALHVCHAARLTDDEVLELARLLCSEAALRAAEKRSGFTPLHKALARCRLRTAAYLVEQGADSQALDCGGRRPDEVFGLFGDPSRGDSR